MSTAERIGVLGGTFDPIHQGHLDVAAAAMEQVALDRVLLIPSAVPPHRAIPPVASAFHRFAMAAIASMGADRLEASDLELRAGGTSYTSDTLARLLDEGATPDQLFFLTGVDAFAEIETWRDYPAILSRCRFVVVARPGYALGTLQARLPALAARMVTPNAGGDGSAARAGGPAILLVDAPTADVSSTAVRQAIAAGHRATGLVPPTVMAYIERHRLYGVREPDPEQAGRLHG